MIRTQDLWVSGSLRANNTTVQCHLPPNAIDNWNLKKQPFYLFRMLRSMANFGDDTGATLDADEAVTVLHERQNGVDDVAENAIDVKLDDCDVFKCELASLGRKAYNLVTEIREASRRRR